MCYGEFEPSAVLSAGCAHYACKGCWAGYLRAYINDAAAVLQLRCIGEKCAAKTPMHVLEDVATEGERALLRSYEKRAAVASNSHASWCTSPDCAFIAYVPQPPKFPTCARPPLPHCGPGVLCRDGARLHRQWGRCCASASHACTLLSHGVAVRVVDGG